MTKRSTAPHSKHKRELAPLDAFQYFKDVAPGRSSSTQPKKAIIFAQGDDADAVFYIRTGKVKIAIVSEQGKEAVVAILGRDEFFGEGCLIGQQKRLATASAMTECVTVRVQKAEITRLLHKPAFSEMFISHVLARNARVLKEPAPAVGVTMLADSSINISLKPWTSVADYGAAQTEIYQDIVDQFRTNNVQIPFPQRDVRMITNPA